MERKRKYFQTSLTENMCAPDATKKSILTNVLLKMQGAQQFHFNRGESIICNVSVAYQRQKVD